MTDQSGLNAEESADGEHQSSTLDELTHAELGFLYQESTETVRFAKTQQWWTVGSTLLVFGALVGIAKLVSADKGYVDLLTVVIILLTMAVIFTLVVYQMWQHTEMMKIENIAAYYSDLFRDVRKLKSRNEANIQRYLLLAFMVFTVTIGAPTAYFGLQQLLLQG
jgi:phage shock protein PspC (stress-responsive transcriptional regulator)